VTWIQIYTSSDVNPTLIKVTDFTAGLLGHITWESRSQFICLVGHGLVEFITAELLKYEVSARKGLERR